MSELRDKLNSGRSAYHAMRYPGDLADELLNRPAGRIGKVVGWIAAAAAVVALALLMSRYLDNSAKPSIVKAETAPATDPMNLILPPMPAMPQGVSIAPPEFDSALLLPSMPSLSLP